MYQKRKWLCNIKSRKVKKCSTLFFLSSCGFGDIWFLWFSFFFFFFFNNFPAQALAQKGERMDEDASSWILLCQPIYSFCIRFYELAAQPVILVSCLTPLLESNRQETKPGHNVEGWYNQSSVDTAQDPSLRQKWGKKAVWSTLPPRHFKLGSVLNSL